MNVEAFIPSRTANKTFSITATVSKEVSFSVVTYEALINTFVCKHNYKVHCLHTLGTAHYENTSVLVLV